MNCLFILDPLEVLDAKWDTSLTLLRELAARGHSTWAADTHEVWYETPDVVADASRICPDADFRYHATDRKRLKARDFQLILIRKEPPFDANYLYLTHLLDHVARLVPVLNHPTGIRNNNEKLSALHFSRWMPETVVSRSETTILDFQDRLQSDVVVKPLDEKGGKGVFLLHRADNHKSELLKQATQNGTQTIMAQRYLTGDGVHGDKRILILDGEVLLAYEKRFGKGDFRGNLSAGASYCPATLTGLEKKLVEEMAPYLKNQGLHFVGIDVLMDRLIEVNVTCPAGLAEAKSLYPQLAPVQTWADSLEALVSGWKAPGAGPLRGYNPNTEVLSPLLP
ncbi:MAG: glutathione synthase [Candidatus Omnitrophota bacterium]|nr:glutathione synthase [Candidatus Omnitrophota bacterium]